MKKQKRKKIIWVGYMFLFSGEIYFWILSEQNANNVSELLMQRHLLLHHTSLWPVGACLQPTTGLRQREWLAYPEQLPREQPAFDDIMVGLGEIDWPCNNARRRPAAWEITMISQSLLSKYTTTENPNQHTWPWKQLLFSTNLLWSPGLHIKVNYCFFFFFLKQLECPVILSLQR